MAEVMPPTPQALCQAVADQYEITIDQLMDMGDASARRARAEAWCVLRDQEEECGRARYTFARIARWWGVGRSVVSQGVYLRRARLSRG